MKKLIATLLALALLIGANAALAVPPLTSNLVKYEGEGYESAADAVTAYFEAMGRGDVMGMLSTFAIESYVDHMDRAAYIERIGTFMPNAGFEGLPMPNAYARDLLAARRWGSLAERLTNQMLKFTWPEDYGEFDLHPVRLGEGEAQAFLDAFDAPEGGEWPGDAGLKGFIPIFLTPFAAQYNSETNQKNNERMRAIYGCDAMSDVVASVRVGGQDFVQFMQCACYDGRWYNLSLQGNAANLAGLDAISGGLTPVE